MTVSREQTKRSRFKELTGLEPTHRNKSIRGEVGQSNKNVVAFPPSHEWGAVAALNMHRKVVESMTTPMQKHKQQRSEEEQIARVAKLAEAQVALGEQKKPGLLKRLWGKLKGE